ncbi:MAG TPA: tRNA (N6-threonylcarbamoyladenosine(37)-N6)-methyltransferase TrmO [Chitinophagaceae bacterium]
METSLKLIGRIKSSLRSTDECPLQETENAPEAIVEVFPEYKEGIRDIHEGSEILLFTWLHQANRSILKCIPRREYDSPMIGVFSTRSPDRPNPIGIHSAKVTGFTNEGFLKVSALEVINGTPLIDIKPVI